MENSTHPTFGTFCWRVISLHMVTYFIFGILSATLFHYKDLFATETMSLLMKPVTSPWVAAGPMLQVIRGLIFALVLWPIRAVILKERYGWFYLWLLFLGLAILGTAGPSLGSTEGIIYTIIPVKQQLIGLPEVILQTLLFSVLLFYWYKKPLKAWNIINAVLVVLIILMSLAGALYSR